MYPFGYCTNVHAGTNRQAIEGSLQQVAIPIKNQVCPNDRLPIGLWLSQATVGELMARQEVADFGSKLKSWGLVPRTLNAFPQHDFHEPVVKHRVYLPTWADSARLTYTCQLAELQANWLAGDQRHGTLSTLPLGWTGQRDSMAFLQACRANLWEFVQFAERLEKAYNVHLRLCIEPEPGCYLGSHADALDFWQDWLSAVSPAVGDAIKRYLGVCHDVCHAAVMFEDQSVCLQRFSELGIVVGKVQVSSALVADFSGKSSAAKSLMRQQLSKFAEPRYLHQTMIDGEFFLEDLQLDCAEGLFAGEWRVHFHVPIFASDLGGGLKTTQGEIEVALKLLSDRPDIDWEIETYAWNVLPPELHTESLAAGILREFQWLEEKFPPRKCL